MANLVPYTQSPFNKARKDKFLLVLNFPQGLKDISQKMIRSNKTIIPDSIQFSVFGAVVPEIEVPVVNVRYSGQTLAASSHSREPYPPVTVNFTVDNRFNNYYVIYKWLDILNSSKTSIFDENNIIEAKKSTSGGNDNMLYRANISIFALDEYDKRIVEFVYTNAFPINLGGITFNNRDAGEVEASFTFVYSQLQVSLVEYIDSL